MTALIATFSTVASGAVRRHGPPRPPADPGPCAPAWPRQRSGVGGTTGSPSVRPPVVQRLEPRPPARRPRAPGRADAPSARAHGAPPASRRRAGSAPSGWRKPGRSSGNPSQRQLGAGHGPASSASRSRLEALDAAPRSSPPSSNSTVGTASGSKPRRHLEGPRRCPARWRRPTRRAPASAVSFGRGTATGCAVAPRRRLRRRARAAPDRRPRSRALTRTSSSAAIALGNLLAGVPRAWSTAQRSRGQRLALLHVTVGAVLDGRFLHHRGVQSGKDDQPDGRGRARRARRTTFEAVEGRASRGPTIATSGRRASMASTAVRPSAASPTTSIGVIRLELEAEGEAGTRARHRIGLCAPRACRRLHGPERAWTQHARQRGAEVDPPRSPSRARGGVVRLSVLLVGRRPMGRGGG